MGAAVSITRLDLTASELRRAAGGEKIVRRRRRILAACAGARCVDRKTAAETCRHGPSDLAGLGAPLQRHGTGRASQSQNRQVRDQTHGAAAGRIGPSLSRLAPTQRCTGWCAGGGSICATNYSGASVSRCTSGRSGRFWPGSATANCRLGPATHRLTKKPRRHLKKLRRDSHGANPRPRQRQADRNLVPG